MDEKEILEKLSILYVEDDNIVREKIAGFLGRRCKNVFKADNGKAGFDLYKKHSPDVVITDIEMPVMDGLEMIEKILELNEKQAVIITTAYDDVQHRSSRVCRNIIKPIVNKKLIEAIVECKKEGTSL